MEQRMVEGLLSPKELAGEFGVHVSYIYAVRTVMRRQGKGWPAGRQRPSVVSQWLEDNPEFRKRDGWSGERGA